MYGIPRITSSYLVDKTVLIETGCATSVNTVLSRLQDMGYLESVKSIIVTHVHLDHGGGAGHLVKALPNLKDIIVHERGAPHLINPERLIESTRRADPLMLEMCGEPLPVSEEKIHPVKGGETINTSEHKISVMYSPGHHPMQVTLIIKGSNFTGISTGDSAGWLWSENQTIMPTTAPPGFDYDQYMNTLEIYRKINPNALLFTHFGVSWEPLKAIEQGINLVKEWTAKIEELLKQDSQITNNELTRRILSQYGHLYSNSPEEMVRSTAEMSISGIVHYLQRKEKNKV